MFVTLAYKRDPAFILTRHLFEEIRYFHGKQVGLIPYINCVSYVLCGCSAAHYYYLSCMLNVCCVIEHTFLPFLNIAIR